MGRKGIVLVHILDYWENCDQFSQSEIDRHSRAVQSLVETGAQREAYIVFVGWHIFGEPWSKLLSVLRKANVPSFNKPGNRIFIGKGFYWDSYNNEAGPRELPRLLYENRVSDVILTGINSVDCTNNAIKNAMLHGFEVVTSPDLVFDAKETLDTLGSSNPFLEASVKMLLPNYKAVCRYITSNPNS